MTKARFTENVIEICTGDDSMAIYLQYMIEQLELCQKSLSGYTVSRDQTAFTLTIDF